MHPALLIQSFNPPDAPGWVSPYKKGRKSNSALERLNRNKMTLSIRSRIQPVADQTKIMLRLAVLSSSLPASPCREFCFTSLLPLHTEIPARDSPSGPSRETRGHRWR